MNTILIITSLIAISTGFSFINARWIKLPGVIGVMVLAILAAIVTVATGTLFPGFSRWILELANSVDFSKTLLDLMLGFLLFASALHFDVNKLKENLRGVLLISTVGVVISTLIFAGILFELLHFTGIDLPFIYCLAFGSPVPAPSPLTSASVYGKKNGMTCWKASRRPMNRCRCSIDCRPMKA